MEARERPSYITLRDGTRLVYLVKKSPTLENAILSASEGFGQPIDPALSLDVQQHLDACHFGFEFTTESGETAGFTLFKRYDTLLCGGGMMIRSLFQRSGLVREGIKLAQQMTGATHLAFRTQSPRMWSAGRKVMRAYGPTPELGFFHPELHNVRERAAQMLGISPTVTAAVFDRPLYSEKPTHLDPTIQAWWDSICQFDQGDMVLCIGAF